MLLARRREAAWITSGAGLEAGLSQPRCQTLFSGQLGWRLGGLWAVALAWPGGVGGYLQAPCLPAFVHLGLATLRICQGVA